MKSKKLIALAIATALTMSSVGMTAFAGSYTDFSDVPGHTDTEGDISINWDVLYSDGSTAGDTFYSGVYDTTLSSWDNGYTIPASALGFQNTVVFGEKLLGYSTSVNGTPENAGSLSFTDDEVDTGGNLILYAIYGEADVDTLLEHADLLTSMAKEAVEYAKANPAAADAQSACYYARDSIAEAQSYISKAKTKSDYDSDDENQVAYLNGLIEEVESLKAEAEAAISAAVASSSSSSSSSSNSSSSSSASSSSASSSNSSSSSSSSSGVTTTKNPHTGEFGVIPVVFLAVAALGVTGAAAYRKRTSAAE